jgi:hypothetical protein
MSRTMPDHDSASSPCHCSIALSALDRRIDQRFIDLEKRISESRLADQARLDERYVNQKDYNTLHNMMQRRMDEQTKDYVSKDAFNVDRDLSRERIAKLERWPWVIGGIVIMVQIVLKFLPVVR